jgi:glutamate/aspartate transport system substrate-binding protein
MMRCAALVALGFALTLPGGAWSAPWSDALSGRMLHIKQTAVVQIGYREGAVPFSYVGADGKPVGYTLDLCRAVVATIADDLGVPLGIDYVRVTPQDRIERVARGDVDFECGSTTNTAERRKTVAFSKPIFVTGTRLAVLAGSGVRSVNDLRGKSVAVVRGTSNEAAMRDVDRLRTLDLRFVVVDGYREALATLEASEVAAVAADEVLVYALLAETKRRDNVRIVGEMLSFEPYGIVFSREEPALADAVDRTLRALAESREIVWIYDRWFVRPLPSGERLSLPMGEELRRSLELIGLPPD